MTTQSPDATEQVARAIFDSHNATYSIGGPAKWESDPEHWRRYARAAIAALPSNATTNASLVEALTNARHALAYWHREAQHNDMHRPWVDGPRARGLDEIDRIDRALATLPSNATTNASLVEALEAIREPTAAMIEAAAATPGMKAAEDAMVMQQVRGYAINPEAVRDGSPLHQAWRAMIDTALATLRASNPDEEGK